jgi:hypothetical protein
MVDKLERIWNDRRDLILKYHPGIRLEVLRKTKKNVSHDSRSRAEIWNWDFPNTKQEY